MRKHFLIIPIILLLANTAKAQIKITDLEFIVTRLKLKDTASFFASRHLVLSRSLKQSAGVGSSGSMKASVYLSKALHKQLIYSRINDQIYQTTYITTSAVEFNMLMADAQRAGYVVNSSSAMQGVPLLKYHKNNSELTFVNGFKNNGEMSYSVIFVDLQKQRQLRMLYIK